jgi:hypothetical protein
MEQLSFDFEAFNESLNVERALIAKDNEEYCSKRGITETELLENLILYPLFPIKYPELNETGYTASPEVMMTGQLRIEQAAKRARGVEMTNNDYKCSRIVWNLEND